MGRKQERMRVLFCPIQTCGPLERLARYGVQRPREASVRPNASSRSKTATSTRLDKITPVSLEIMNSEGTLLQVRYEIENASKENLEASKDLIKRCVNTREKGPEFRNG